MSVSQPKTVVIHAHGMVAAMSTNVIVQMLSKKLDFKRITAIQFIPNGRFRVTCTSVEYRNTILAMKVICIDGIHELQITESDTPVTTVYVHYLPPEAGDAGLRLMLAPFGKVLGITNQRFSGFKQICTGTRIVRMALEQHIPFQFNVQGYPCRVWYAGQPLKCTICKGAHKAADCPDRNKCKLCRQSGHFAKDCKNAWGTTPQDVPHAQMGTPPPPPGPNPTPPSAAHAPGPDPPDPAPSASGHVTPSGSDPPVIASVDNVDSAADHVPPPLMSVDVQPPEQLQVEVLASSQDSLASESDSIDEFTEEDSSLVATPSPTISSFPSENCSQSILNNVTIVSNDPMEVEQINSSASSANSNETGKSNETGPNVAQGKSNDNVMGPKVAQSKSKSNGQSNVTGSKVTPCKSNVTGPRVAHNSGNRSVSPNSQNSTSNHSQVESDSSSSESSFKAPYPPRPRRSPTPSPQRGRSRSPLVPGSPSGHRGMPQVTKDRPSRRY